MCVCHVAPESDYLTDADYLTDMIKMQHASDCVLVFDEMALKRKLVYNRERDCILYRRL